MKKKISILFLIMFIMTSLTPCNIFADNTNNKTLVLSIKEKKLAVGQSYSIKAETEESGQRTVMDVNDLSYESSNASVASVSDKGSIKGNKPGITSITVKTKDESNLEERIKVTVVPCKVNGIKLVEGVNKVKISYKKTPGASKYVIYKSTNKKSGYKKVTSTTKLKYVDKKFKHKKEKKFYYKVKAVNGSYSGSYSTVKKIKVRYFKKIKVRCTAYCACSRCCGSNAIGRTASGKRPKADHTLATGRCYKFGQKIYFPAMRKKANKGIYVVEDRMGSSSTKVIDIYFKSHRKAIIFGRRTLIAYVIK